MFNTLKRAALTGAMAALSLSTACYASTLAGGPIAGGTSQGAAACYLFNTGSSAVSFASYGIIAQLTNNYAPLTYNTCGSSIAAGTSCGLAANVANTQAYTCTFTTSGSAATLRGTMDVRVANGSTILISTPLR